MQAQGLGQACPAGQTSFPGDGAGRKSNDRRDHPNRLLAPPPPPPFFSIARAAAVAEIQAAGEQGNSGAGLSRLLLSHGGGCWRSHWSWAVPGAGLAGLEVCCSWLRRLAGSVGSGPLASGYQRGGQGRSGSVRAGSGLFGRRLCRRPVPQTCNVSENSRACGNASLLTSTLPNLGVLTRSNGDPAQGTFRFRAGCHCCRRRSSASAGTPFNIPRESR